MEDEGPNVKVLVESQPRPSGVACNIVGRRETERIKKTVNIIAFILVSSEPMVVTQSGKTKQRRCVNYLSFS